MPSWRDYHPSCLTHGTARWLSIHQTHCKSVLHVFLLCTSSLFIIRTWYYCTHAYMYFNIYLISWLWKVLTNNIVFNAVLCKRQGDRKINYNFKLKITSWSCASHSRLPVELSVLVRHECSLASFILSSPSLSLSPIIIIHKNTISTQTI